jgi:hypothetical protein
MKPIRNVLFAAFLIVIVVSAVSYTACNKNHCGNVVCLHLGVCNDGSCLCPTGFEGNNCEILSRDKFIFTYNGGDTCDSAGYRQYPIHLLAIAGDTLELKMTNFLNNLQDSAICTIQSTDSFSFIGSNNSTIYNGTGKLSHDTLIMYYNVVHDTITYNCVYKGIQ